MISLKLCTLLAVPHFEKMLYDQAQLANVYLDAFSIANDVFYSLVCRDILDYLRRDMIGPEGEIFSAEDADSAEHGGSKMKKEGAFYVWTSEEVYYTLDLLQHHFHLHLHFVFAFVNYDSLRGLSF